MSTIGIRAAKMLNVKPKTLINALNTRTNIPSELGPLMKPNRALTSLGKDVFQAEKQSFKVNSLEGYIKALVESLKSSKYLEPFQTMLENIPKVV